MSHPAGMSEGGRVQVPVAALAAGGRGVGRDNVGRAWFIEGAVPGDLVEAEAIRVHGRYAEGRVARLVRASPRRRPPACPIQGRCGGCPWMVLPEEAQRDAKREILRDALQRIGRFTEPPLDPVVAAPEPLAYRNKIELSFGRAAAGARVLGFHRAGTAAVEDVPACPVADAAANRILATVRAFFLDGEGRADASVDADADARVVLRRSRATGRHLVVLRGSAGSFPTAPRLAEALAAAHPEIAGVVLLEAPPGRRGGSRAIVLLGEGTLEETLAGVRFRVPAGTFFQVNPEAAESLVRLVLSASAGTRHAVDLYGGVGAFGLPMARAGSHVTVVEADAAAVAAGREAVGANGISRVRFIHAGATEGLAEVARRGPRPDLVVADPPRTGFGPGVAGAIARLRPGRVVLVGCDPATFARDAAALRRGGYRLDRVAAIDLFPQTAHVEAVGVLVHGPARQDRS